jgi:hypothetical protein
VIILFWERQVVANIGEVLTAHIRESLGVNKPKNLLSSACDNSLECDGLAALWPDSPLWPALVECFASADQSGAGPPHSKELTLYLTELSQI